MFVASIPDIVDHTNNKEQSGLTISTSEIAVTIGTCKFSDNIASWILSIVWPFLSARGLLFKSKTYGFSNNDVKYTSAVYGT